MGIEAVGAPDLEDCQDGGEVLDLDLVGAGTITEEEEDDIFLDANSNDELDLDADAHDAGQGANAPANSRVDRVSSTLDLDAVDDSGAGGITYSIMQSHDTEDIDLDLDARQEQDADTWTELDPDLDAATCSGSVAHTSHVMQASSEASRQFSVVIHHLLPTL